MGIDMILVERACGQPVVQVGLGQSISQAKPKFETCLGHPLIHNFQSSTTSIPNPYSSRAMARLLISTRAFFPHSTLPVAPARAFFRPSKFLPAVRFSGDHSAVKTLRLVTTRAGASTSSYIFAFSIPFSLILVTALTALKIGDNLDKKFLEEVHFVISNFAPFCFWDLIFTEILVICRSCLVQIRFLEF